VLVGRHSLLVSLAQYQPVEGEGKENTTGELLVTKDKKSNLRDWIVISTLVLQQRAAAHGNVPAKQS